MYGYQIRIELDSGRIFHVSTRSISEEVLIVQQVDRFDQCVDSEISTFRDSEGTVKEEKLVRHIILE